MIDCSEVIMPTHSDPIPMILIDSSQWRKCSSRNNRILSVVEALLLIK